MEKGYADAQTIQKICGITANRLRDITAHLRTEHPQKLKNMTKAQKRLGQRGRPSVLYHVQRWKDYVGAVGAGEVLIKGRSKSKPPKKTRRKTRRKITENVQKDSVQVSTPATVSSTLGTDVPPTLVESICQHYLATGCTIMEACQHFGVPTPAFWQAVESSEKTSEKWKRTQRIWLNAYVVEMEQAVLKQARRLIQTTETRKTTSTLEHVPTFAPDGTITTKPVHVQTKIETQPRLAKPSELALAVSQISRLKEQLEISMPISQKYDVGDKTLDALQLEYEEMRQQLEMLEEMEQMEELEGDE